MLTTVYPHLNIKIYHSLTVSICKMQKSLRVPWISHDIPVHHSDFTASQATGSDIVQRILDILKFLWVLFLAMVDGFTIWLNMLTKQYVDTSTLLSEERYLFIHNISQVGISLKQTLSNVSLALFSWILIHSQRPSREPMDDQISQDSENLTVETCLDETDTDNVHFNSNVK